ncbi:MAG: phosphate regulon transcriptional regulator PhoB [Alphaproteobacteria bacterium]|nr:phosphate regulon transcriptional regulator PhoB [Alphaproteobacteria bacterium]MYE58035.1 phosphate regulon transcriptional regulatory protein PhoB [Alphaproteobacteria bacterium]
MSAERPHILVVEDEAPIVELLRYNLETSGYSVSVATDGDEALERVTEAQPDAVLLDWMLPRKSGIEVCRQLRAKAGTRMLPIILLTARGEEADRVRGLDTGADDYIVKPFSPKELEARLKAVLRRSRPALVEERLEYRGIVIDLASHRVSRGGRKVHLGPTEYRLLRTLLERPTRVFSRARLLDAVWGRDVYVEERTVDVHIRRLRKALNGEGEPDAIRTVRSGGYALDLDR